jgi:hypothetical protein
MNERQAASYSSFIIHRSSLPAPPHGRASAACHFEL